MKSLKRKKLYYRAIYKNRQQERERLFTLLCLFKLTNIMWFEFLLCLVLFSIFNSRMYFDRSIFNSKCQLSKIDSRYKGPLPQVAIVCIPIAKYGLDGASSIIDALEVMGSKDGTQSISFAAEFNSNADILHLQQRNLIMMNIVTLNKKYSQQSVRCKLTPQNQLEPLSTEVFASESTFGFYARDFKFSNVTLRGNELCWVELYLQHVKINKGKKL